MRKKDFYSDILIMITNVVCILGRENAVKTYVGLKKVKQNENDLRIDKCKQWLVNVSIPTISSDLPWDNFGKNNYESINYYRTLTYNKQKSPLNKHCEY